MRNRALVQRGAAASTWLFLAAVPAAILLGISAAAAAGAPVRVHGIPRAGGPMHRVIVLLRDKPAALAKAGPLAAALRAQGGRHVATGRSLPFVVASVSAAQRQALAADPLVRAVLPDSKITVSPPTAPTAPPIVPSVAHAAGHAAAASLCGTAQAPENDPEALGVIKATQANALGYDGAGVKVAYIAGPIDTTIADFKRNAKYASAHSAAGSPVVTSVNFTGDPNTTPSPDAAGESFLDASSIAAQGNTTYDLADFVNAAHPLPAGCDIKVTGAAPGATVLGLSTFSSINQTTEASFIQAIDYAVAHGVKVLNESFTSNNFPDTALDATRIADDYAVAKGVTVVVSSGDGGITNTIGSPGTDPKLISVGASTTFRAYAQDTYGGINATTPRRTRGTWIDNNISSLSSAGFDQGRARTVDLVAPGDLNWALCSTNTALYGCTDENGAPSGLQLSGGTSESAPLTAAAAADVIQAYASTHHGRYPSPALVKKILTSTATDIGAPAEQQGAGLLDVLAAVKEATSIDRKKGGRGTLLFGPGQINISQNQRATATRRIAITNTGNRTATVHLSTRTLTHKVSSQAGSFCLNPTGAAIACGEPTASTFRIWSGVTEVYQEQTFFVPKTGKASRLNFSADYLYNGQTSVLHVALYDPTGAYAGYSLPQGFANYANVQVADPRPGTWTAVFFTVQDTASDFGTSGNIQWQADTWDSGPAGTLSPAKLTIRPGATARTTLTVKSPARPGDIAESVVVKSNRGPTNTIPVTVRTRVRMRHSGGSFSGVLTGGNGRDNPAQSNTYAFQVPRGKRDLDVSARFADTNDGVVAMLENPQGQVVASSSNITFDSAGANIIGTGAVNVYVDAPQPGRWRLLLDWIQPVSGAEISEPFTGRIRFDQVDVRSNLPKPGKRLARGHRYFFHVTVKNTAQSPELFFLDPRNSRKETIRLADLNGSDQNMSLPLALGAFPLYIVPTGTTGLKTSLTGSGPVGYDIGGFAGDPDLAPTIAAPGVVQSQSGNSASLNFTAPTGVSPGPWYLNPSEIGPYPASGAPAMTASARFQAVLQAFDPTVDTATGDLWTWLNGLSGGFAPVYLLPGQSTTIPLAITPDARHGKHVTGTIRVDDVFQANFVTGLAIADGDELASIPFGYTVR